MAHHRLARYGQLAVATLLRGKIDDHAAGLHRLHHFGGDELGCRLAGDQGRGDDDVHLPGLLGIHLALGRLETLAHDLGVAAAARALFLVVHLDELAAHGLDLIGHFGAGVIGAHDGAKARSRAQGCKTGDAGTGNEHLGRRDLARGGDLAGEEAAEMVSGLDHGAVAHNASHGGQRVHFLSAG